MLFLVFALSLIFIFIMFFFLYFYTTYMSPWSTFYLLLLAGKTFHRIKYSIFPYKKLFPYFSALAFLYFLLLSPLLWKIITPSLKVSKGRARFILRPPWKADVCKSFYFLAVIYSYSRNMLQAQYTFTQFQSTHFIYDRCVIFRR